MHYLYLGFLLAQSFSVAQVIYNANIPILTVLFSVIVFLIWSFFPILGYALARAFGKKLVVNKYVLITLGLSISLLEQLLYHLDILTSKDGYLTILLTAAMFFAIAFLPLNRKGMHLGQQNET